MRTPQWIREKIFQLNQEEYSGHYHEINWISEQTAQEAAIQREEILSKLRETVRFDYNDTKLYTQDLSKGCRICGEGTWSCLFVNGKCNCSCFFCPSEQKIIGVPVTNTLQFPKTGDYIDYIERFQFRGVGLSGGEPLLTLQTTLNFLRSLKKKFDQHLYIWLYTNGILVTDDVLKNLRDAGLDEIRFDIVAFDYNLKKPRMAVGMIPFVTIEIPAIPEDYELLKSKLFEMKDAGINYLNLHQLRLTPHNFSKLVKRNYTFLHGEKVTVLESEFTALKLLEYNMHHGIRMPINYCSFIYKHSFQRAAARKRSAEFVKKSYEDITDNGYIRYLYLTGPTDTLHKQSEIFAQSNIDPTCWFKPNGQNRLYFSSSVWQWLQFDGLDLCAGYYEPKLLSSKPYGMYSLLIPLNNRRDLVVAKLRVGQEFKLTLDEVHMYGDVIINGKKNHQIQYLPRQIQEMLEFEFMHSGPQEIM